MRPRGLGIASVLVGLLLFVHVVPGGAQEIDRHAEELAQLRNRIQALSRSLERERGQADSYSDELREVENRIGRIVLKLRIITNSLKRQKKQVAKLRKRAQEQNLELEMHRRLLARQVRTAYAMGRQERIKILLNQEDPTLLSRMLEYHNYLTEERAKRIGLIRGILQQLQLTRDAIAEEEKRLAELRGKALNRKRELEQTKEARQKVLWQLQQRITGHDQELARLKRDMLNLQKLIVGLRDALEDIPAKAGQNKPFSAGKGRMSWPTTGRLLAAYDDPRDDGVKWDGVYIGADEGKPVRAIHHGRVAYADWLRGFGLLLIIDHGNGYMSLYGHNQSLFKEVGEWVEAGEQIASVGYSGGLKKSGIYFGLRYNGKPLNPSSWCKSPQGKRIGFHSFYMPGVSVRQYSAKVIPYAKGISEVFRDFLIRIPLLMADRR